MLEEARIWLEQSRQDSNFWFLFAYHPLVHPKRKDDILDKQGKDRYQLLLAMQYDRKPDDLDLLRYLLRQEIIMHRKAPFQGLYESLRLASYLLALHKKVEDIWLLAEAKFANFDTFCGFDIEYLLAAGIKESLAYIKAHPEHELQKEIKKKLFPKGKCIISQSKLVSFWRQQHRQYPTKQEKELLITRIEQALFLEKKEEALSFLHLWENQKKDPPSLWTRYCYYDALEKYEKALSLVYQLLAQQEEMEKAASFWVQIGRLYRLLKKHQEAFQALQMAYVLVQKITLSQGKSNFRPNSTGRSLMEQYLDLVEELTDDKPFAQKAFQIAASLLEEGYGVCIFNLERFSQISLSFGWKKQARQFQKKLQQEIKKVWPNKK